MRSASAIQIGSNTDLEERRKIPHRTVERDGRNRPRQAEPLEGLTENQRHAHNPREQNPDWHKIDI